MFALIALIVIVNADYSGCGCCEVNGKCDVFQNEWSWLDECIKHVPQEAMPTDPNWFKIVRLPNATYDKCTAPTGFSPSDTAPVYTYDNPCTCFGDFADRIMNSFSCGTEFLKSLDEVCNTLGCKYCNFITPKCGDTQLRRCDLVYQQEIALNKYPTSDDICRALAKKVECYDSNHCVYADIPQMQQTVKQCRNSTCPACYQICKNGAISTFALFALVLLAFVF
uniref:Uncharacterized protein n=1 Tax=Entamoeba histolytica TaxID=5759 RepID=S0AWI2_ENTHI|nr:hypothetical protein [Entamoeba histolytica]